MIDQLRSGFHGVIWAAFGVAAAIVLVYAGRTSFDAFLRALTGIGTLAIAVTVWRTTRAYYTNTVLIADRKLRLDLHEKRVPLYQKLREIIEEIDVKTWDRSIGIDSTEQYHALATRVRALADDITIYFADESLSKDVAGISAYVHDFVGTRMLNHGERPDKEYFRTLGRRLADVNARMLRRVQLRDAL